MDPITKDVKHKHASSNTINHVLYAHFTAKRSLNDCATLFGKSLRTIQRWVSKFKRDGTVGRKKRDNPPLKFTAKHRTWLIKLYRKKPVLYLDEAKAQFQAEFGMTIGRSTIFLIMKTEGYTRQALERRAFEIKLPLIFRFAEELRSFLWTVLNLVFLDESSFDNRSMWRHFGYGKKGGRLVYRGEFRRKQRISVLAFLAHDGIQEVFTTEGTFTRLKFLDCCRKFALSGQVETHPGRNSVWVMDGARIHCSSAIVDYLRSLGLRVIFLPPQLPVLQSDRTVLQLHQGQVTTVLRRGMLRSRNGADGRRDVPRVYQSGFYTGFREMWLPSWRKVRSGSWLPQR